MRLPARGLLVAIAVLLGGCADDADDARRSDSTERVERYFDDSLALNPTDATDIGDHRFDDRLEITPSPAYEAASRELERRALADVARPRSGGARRRGPPDARDVHLQPRARCSKACSFPRSPAADRASSTAA